MRFSLIFHYTLYSSLALFIFEPSVLCSTVDGVLFSFHFLTPGDIDCFCYSGTSTFRDYILVTCVFSTLFANMKFPDFNLVTCKVLIATSKCTQLFILYELHGWIGCSWSYTSNLRLLFNMSIAIVNLSCYKW